MTERRVIDIYLMVYLDDLRWLRGMHELNLENIIKLKSMSRQYRPEMSQSKYQKIANHRFLFRFLQDDI